MGPLFAFRSNPLKTLVESLVAQALAALQADAPLVYGDGERLFHAPQTLDALAALRTGLREQVRTSPLFDGPRFALAFTDALEVAASA